MTSHQGPRGPAHHVGAPALWALCPARDDETMASSGYVLSEEVIASLPVCTGSPLLTAPLFSLP